MSNQEMGTGRKATSRTGGKGGGTVAHPGGGAGASTGGGRAATARSSARVAKPQRPPTPMELLRDQVARELGLMDKVAAEGWGGLTAAESGRVGARMSQHLKALRQAGAQLPG
jgi:hypothetical protein